MYSNKKLEKKRYESKEIVDISKLISINESIHQDIVITIRKTNVLIENYKRVDEVSDEIVRVRGKNAMSSVQIKGKHMYLEKISQDIIKIRGEIEDVSFFKRKSE